MTNGYNMWQVMGNWCFTRQLDTTWTTPKKNSQKNERCFAQLIEWLIVWLKENGQDQMQRGFNLHFSENVKFYCWTSDVSSTHNQGKTVSRIISMKISLKNCNNCRQFRRAVTGVGLTQLVICRPRQNLSYLANPDGVNIKICPPW